MMNKFTDKTINNLVEEYIRGRIEGLKPYITDLLNTIPSDLSKETTHELLSSLYYMGRNPDYLEDGNQDIINEYLSKGDPIWCSLYTGVKEIFYSYKEALKECVIVESPEAEEKVKQLEEALKSAIEEQDLSKINKINQ